MSTKTDQKTKLFEAYRDAAATFGELCMASEQLAGQKANAGAALERARIALQAHDSPSPSSDPAQAPQA